MSNKISRDCKICGKEFFKRSTTSVKDWSQGYKACSRSCGSKLRGAPWLEKHKLKPGAQLGKATQFKRGERMAESNFLWKGDDASYAAKHMWVKYHYGKPQFCEHCFTDIDRMYHWANVSMEYKRERSDWLRLCVPCHKQFDLSRKGGV